MPTLDFKGKNHIYAHHLTVPYRPLQLDASRSMLASSQDGDIPLTDQNLIIHGDNLEALKALLPHYAGRVKCIYIDPPYNTGNEGWVYNDNVRSPLMQDWLRKHSPVDGEDLERHDKWLCMMWPRLHLLRELLRDDGVIFVSIDDNEVHHLRMLMDEVFGEENFIAHVVWHSKYTQSNDARYLSRQHESVLLFARNKPALFKLRIKRPTSMNKSYTNPDNDPRGPWKPTPLHAKSGSGNYKHVFANGYEWTAPVGRYPRFAPNRLRMLEKDSRIYFGKHGTGIPNVKTFLSELDDGVVSPSIWHYSEVGHTHGANEEFAEVMGKGVFDNPKPTGLIERAIQLSTLVPSGNSEATPVVILDSFAGSGTTAHAVLALNKEDGGNRRFILVECEDYADSITAERVRRVISGVPNAKNKQLKDGLGGSFAYCTLGEAIDIESLLKGDALPSFFDIASYLLHTATGISALPDDLEKLDGDGRFYSDGERDYYLIYQPILEFLRSGNAALNLERAERIREKDRPAVVFAAATYISQSALSKWRITFCQLPYELGFGG